jgi:carbamoyltransferase
MTYFLGLFGYGPNPSAALVRNGRIVAFAEEERFNRIKTAPSHMPISAIDFCLKEAGIGLGEVRAIGFGWECDRYITDMPPFYARLREEFPSDHDEYGEIYEEFLLKNYHPVRIITNLRHALTARGHELDPDKVRFLPHHLCHAASTYYCSGMERASILTIDGSGEDATTLMWHGKGQDITEIERYQLPHSLGAYYATFTEFLGFRPYHDEGKLMGLAPYGKYSAEIQEKLEAILPFDDGTGAFRVNPYMRYLGRSTYSGRFTDDFVEIFGKPRLSRDAMDDQHRDLAFNVQWRLEEVVKRLTRDLIARTGSGNLCLAGGVAMNCKMNGALAQIPEVENIFVQPAAADNGIGLGAALLLAQENGEFAGERMMHAYWGPSYGDDEVEEALKEAKVDYRRAEDVAQEVAGYLNDGKIVGWFQGRMEIGARALGNRSILANPAIKDMREKLNAEVKHREGWRPFCPSMTYEDYDRYFSDTADSDFMIQAFEVRDEYKAVLPAVVHVDGTARPQTVREDSNPRFHALLRAFEALSGHPVLVNTSFNIMGEPIVCTPRDALRCFGGTGLDVLVMNDFVVMKRSG